MAEISLQFEQFFCFKIAIRTLHVVVAAFHYEVSTLQVNLVAIWLLNMQII